MSKKLKMLKLNVEIFEKNVKILGVFSLGQSGKWVPEKSEKIINSLLGKKLIQ